MAVTPDQVATTLGASCPARIPYEQWEMWIADAEMLLRSWANRQGYSYGLFDAVTLDYVIREAVADRAKRPDDVTQVDIAVDDGRVSKRYASGSGQITFRDEWLDMLRPADASTGGAFSIALSYAADTVCR